MKNLYQTTLLVAVTFMCATPLFGQFQNHDRIEKAYIQTDKPMYMPGDEIWIKAWVVNGANMPTVLSQKATIELIKPDGSKLMRKEILIEDGVITEYLKLDVNANGGIYQLKINTPWMSTLDQSYKYSKEITVQKYDPPRLLMKIDLDKEGYGKGEPVVASFNVKDLKDRPISSVGVEYTLFVEGIETQKLHKESDIKGESNAEFVIPNQLKSTNISVNAKIKYRGQIESISERIPVVLENIDLQFLPEGGSLLEGFENVLAFKAVSEMGEPTDVSGEIVDSNGNKVSDFSSAHYGMGKINFRPEENKNYFAKICSPYESSKLIPIKYKVSEGIKFTVVDHSDQKVKLEIIGGVDNNMSLVLSNLCDVVWTKSLENQDNQNVIIPIESLPQGIHKISLQNNGNTTCERLIFLHPERGMQVTLSTDKSIYGLREKVIAQVKTTDYKGNPVSGDFGISVVEDKMLSFADDKQGHLTTELLLSSELNGDINEPNYYFDSITVETKTHLDLVMLTHGWRSYMEDVSNEEATTFLFDQNSYVGQVCSRKGHKGIKTQVLIQENNSENVRVVDTDADGYFVFPLHKNKSFKLIAKTKSYNSFIKNVKIKELKEMRSELATALKEKWLANPNFLAMEKPEYGQEEEIRNISPMNISLTEGQLLDEVVVVGYGNQLMDKRTSCIGYAVTGEAIRRLPTKSINAIAANVAGISVADGGDISIRGSRTNATEYYVDGVRVSGLIPQSKEMKDEFNIYDRRYSRKIKTKSNHPLIVHHINHYINRSNKKQFYIPKYKKSEITVRSDFRQTIYWNPRIQTDEKGEATFSFYTSDEITSFSMIAEGLTADGMVGRDVEKIVAVKPLNIDCKLPSYFVLGDTAQISIVINNDSDTDQHVKLEANAIDLQFDISDLQSILVKKGESFVYQLQVTPKNEIAESNFNIKVKSERDFDVLTKKIAILNPYFPQQFSFSGIDSDTFNVELFKPLEGSIKAEMKVYNPVTSALEGIQSLLRRPSGCFEQVSSSTYPNVMICQYLKKDNQSKKEHMDKAMNYIEEGYKKLAAYETTKDGFEWYGRTPPNVALTAYGLLEFSDMSKIYDGVDKKMLFRTIDFLLDQRDGKGGFNNPKGKYAFSNVSKIVQNAYVLYALSNQKIKTIDIAKEYTAAKKNALDSHDLYLTALMALTAYNQGYQNDYQELLDKVIADIGQKDLKNITCKSTIMRSGKNDKNIETLSLCAMAIIRGNLSNRPLVKKIIDHIFSSRRGGRFGSTQATCLAIQAILAYADWDTKKVNTIGSTITASIDNDFSTDIKNQVDLTDQITSNTHQVQVQYSSPNNKSFEMTVDYMSKIPPSSENPELALSTRLMNSNCALADQVSMEVVLTNLKDKLSANPTIILGIPAGMSIQMDQLKEFKEQRKIDYFEVFENKLVLYFDELDSLEKKKLLIDLKADISGQYTAPPSCAYPYYDDQNTTWISGTKVTISRDQQPLNF